MANEESLTPEDELEDLLYELFELDFGNHDAIAKVEADVFPLLQKNPNNICAWIVLMFVEIMRGNRMKAQSIARKIWEIGGKLPSFFEMIYLENLLSLGLVDMAMVLLKPRFEHLAENLEEFYSVLLKFSVMTGNIGLLQRIEAFPFAQENDEALFTYVKSFTDSGKSDMFKNIQKVILDTLGDSISAYEYQLDGENLSTLEIELYLNSDATRCLSLQQQLNQKIRVLLLSANETSTPPVKITVRNIKDHEAWLPEE